MHRIMDCQQLPSVSQSIFLSSFLVQLVIPTPSEVLLLSLLSLSLSSLLLFILPRTRRAYLSRAYDTVILNGKFKWETMGTYKLPR